MRVLCLSLVFFIISCKKEKPVPETQGTVVFHHSQTTATDLVDQGAITLSYYVDSELAGSMAADKYSTPAPECGQDGTFTFNKNLNGAKEKTFIYSVQDQTGYEFFSGTGTLTDGACARVVLR